MEEKLSYSYLGHKSLTNFPSTLSNKNIVQGSYFPVYIFTGSFHSLHLPVLQKGLEKENIVICFQDSNEELKKMKKTHQSRVFVVLNDMSDVPPAFSNKNSEEYFIVNYPATSIEQVIAFYRQFVAQQLNKPNFGAKSTIRIPTTIIRQQHQEGQKNVHQSSRQKSSVKLKNVTKIINNYKASLPKKLFIYSNKNDEEIYHKYVTLIQGMCFDNATFISQIQEYIKCIPEKQDVSFCVLMSQYSALNLRKFFKAVDQIILLGCNKQKCFPLLRGKVTFFTTQIESLDKLLVTKFGMKQKKAIESAVNVKTVHFQQKNSEEISHEVDQKLKSKLESKLDQNHSQRNTSRSLEIIGQTSTNFRISQQYCLLNEQPTRSLLLQSNIIDYAVQPAPLSEVSHKSQKQSQIANLQLEPQVFKFSTQPQVPKNDQFNVTKKDVPFFTVKEIIEKVNPLKIVHLQVGSIANISIRSSEITQDRHLFQQLIDKLNNESSIVQMKVQQSQLAGGYGQDKDYQNLQSYKQNSVHSIKSTHSSRFSNAPSRNSRIIKRIQQGRARGEQKLQQTN